MPAFNSFINVQMWPSTSVRVGCHNILYCTSFIITDWGIWAPTVCLSNYSFAEAGCLWPWEAHCRCLVSWSQTRASEQSRGKPTVDSAVFSYHVMLTLLEMDGRLDGHLGIMKHAVFIQVKILRPSLGLPLIINMTLCNERRVNNDVYLR